MRQFSDEDLTVYLDGETDAALSRDIETAIAERPELSQRLADLHVDKDALKDTFDALLSVAPIMPDPQPVAPVKSFGASGFLKIAAGLLLALGIGWTLGNTGSDLEEWQDYAAAYHKLYVEETLATSDFTEETLRSQLAQTTQSVGVDLTLEVLRGFDRLELRRAQVLGFEDAKIAHIALQDEMGRPYALCIADASDQSALAFAQNLGLETARWSKGTSSYYLIGGTDAEIIEQAARYLAEL